ncbi:hypothetical protein SADUNF_Sadunf16G0070400 [Salix dunnii]|uniref:Uncharacterized protein n=1 Tax=Salix dunnii TaxID=1413687 RepID=A0A835J9N7_9ROSI|nr:hypothetical protein SADUNF_Sadunf16G0070400 [Salix dunnii]
MKHFAFSKRLIHLTRYHTYLDTISIKLGMSYIQNDLNNVYLRLEGAPGHCSTVTHWRRLKIPVASH